MQNYTTLTLKKSTYKYGEEEEKCESTWKVPVNARSILGKYQEDTKKMIEK